MSVFDHPEFDHHEAVHYAHDKASGLKSHYFYSFHRAWPSRWRLPTLAIR